MCAAGVSVRVREKTTGSGLRKSSKSVCPVRIVFIITCRRRRRLLGVAGCAILGIDLFVCCLSSRGRDSALIPSVIFPSPRPLPVPLTLFGRGSGGIHESEYCYRYTVTFPPLQASRRVPEGGPSLIPHISVFRLSADTFLPYPFFFPPPLPRSLRASGYITFARFSNSQKGGGDRTNISDRGTMVSGDTDYDNTDVWYGYVRAMTVHIRSSPSSYGERERGLGLGGMERKQGTHTYTRPTFWRLMQI